MSSLFVLDHPSFYELAEQRMRSIASTDTLVFCPPTETHAIPESLKKSILASPDYTEAERERIDRAAEQIAAEWSKSPAIQSISHLGVHLPEMLEHGMDYFLVWIIRQHVMTLKILDEVRPDKIYIAKEIGAKGPFAAAKESYYGYFFEQAALQRGIPVELIANKKITNGYRVSVFEPSTSKIEKVLLLTMNAVGRMCMALNPSKRAINFSNPRAAKPLLERTILKTPWMMLTLKPSPKTTFRLLGMGVPTISLSASSMDYSNRFATVWEVKKYEILKNPALIFEGLNLAEAMEERLKSIFCVDLPALTRWVDAFEAFLKRTKPVLAVLDEDVTILKRTFALLAQKNSAACCVIQHGATGQRRGYAPSVATAVGVWGEVSKKQLIQWGVEPQKIHITGYTGLTVGTSEEKKHARQNVLNHLKFAAGSKIVLFAACRLRTQEHGFLRVKMLRHQNAGFLRSAVLAMQQFPQHYLVIKLHPGENVEYAQSLLRQAPSLDLSRTRVVLDYNLRELLLGSDALVSIASTVSIDAMANDIPVVDLNLFGMQPFIPYEGVAPVVSARTQSELESALAECLNQPEKRRADRKRFIQAYCGDFNAQEAADRAINLLQTLIAEDRRTVLLQQSVVFEQSLN